MPGRYAIGIDAGGTKLAAGLVDTTNGTVLGSRRVPSDVEDGGAAVLDRVLGLAEELKAAGSADGAAAEAIGLGIAETVDLDGRLTSFETYAWQDVDYAGRLKAILPTVVDSDIRTAALAEARFGEGAGSDWFAYVSVGTGIGGCLVKDGVPIAGARGNAMILGSGTLSAICDACGADVSRALEEFASGPGMVRAYAEADGKAEDCEAVFRLAEDGDDRAAAAVDRAGHALGVSVGFLVNLADPALVVIGGGVGLAGGRFRETFERSLRDHVWSANTRDLAVRDAALGEDAGVVGAALAATQGPAARP